MCVLRRSGLLFALCFLLAASVYSAQAEDATKNYPFDEPLPESLLKPLDGFPDDQKTSVTIEAVVVNPYQSADVGSQVGGVIERFHFDEGDLVREGQVVVEVSPTRYVLAAQRAEERLQALRVVLNRAEAEAKVKAELFALDASSRQDLIKTQSEAELARYRVAEAKREMDLALLDVESCSVKAPFTGYLAVRYRQPYETVERLGRIFSLVDTSKVYALANVPEPLLPAFKKESEAIYVHGPGKTFKGTVQRIGKLIDPKSRTKRVYLLIDNSDAALEVGMTGTLQLPR